MEKFEFISKRIVTGNEPFNKLLGGGFMSGKLYTFVDHCELGSDIVLRLLSDFKRFNSELKTENPKKRKCVLMITDRNEYTELDDNADDGIVVVNTSLVLLKMLYPLMYSSLIYASYEIVMVIIDEPYKLIDNAESEYDINNISDKLKHLALYYNIPVVTTWYHEEFAKSPKHFEVSDFVSAISIPCPVLPYMAYVNFECKKCRYNNTSTDITVEYPIEVNKDKSITINKLYEKMIEGVCDEFNYDETKGTMIKEFVNQWNKYNNNLVEYFRKTPQSEYNDYTTLVELVIEKVINYNSGTTYNTEAITAIDNGDYQGTLLYIIPRNTYQPSVEDYIFTSVYYGSCSGCDTLLSISEYGSGIPSDEQIKDYMMLCLHIVENFKRLS